MSATLARVGGLEADSRELSSHELDDMAGLEVSMAHEGVDLRISLERLLIGLLLTIVPLSLVGLYLTTRGELDLQRSVGSHFEIVADSKAGQISQFVNDVVIASGAIASTPDVIEEVAAADRSYGRGTPPAGDSRIQAVQKEWNTPQDTSVATKLLSTRAARLMKRYCDADRRFLRITVSDAKGVVVAATHKPALYFYGSDEKWLAVQAGGKGAVQLTDVKYDNATKTNYISVGVPILDEGSSRFLGEVQSLVDISPVAALMNRGLTGSGPQASLLRRDGTIIFGPDMGLSMNVKSAEYSSVNDAVSASGGRGSGFVVAELSGGRNLVGFADTGLKRDYGTLDWIVLVSQDEAMATAPTRVVIRFAFAMVILGLLMVVIFAVYYYLHRRLQFTGIASSDIPQRSASQTS